MEFYNLLVHGNIRELSKIYLDTGLKVQFNWSRVRPKLSVFEKLPRDFNTQLELSLEGTPLSISGSPWKMLPVCSGVTGQPNGDLCPLFLPFLVVPPSTVFLRLCLALPHPCSLPSEMSISALSRLPLLQALLFFPGTTPELPRCQH